MNPRKFTKRNMERFMRSIIEGDEELPIGVDKHPELGE
jgi:hypothetical protein